MELNHSHSKHWRLFCSSGLTLRWCNAARLGFSGECAREGPSQEEEALFLNSRNGRAGKRRPGSWDECPGGDWWPVLGTAKFTLSLPLRGFTPAPTCPLQTILHEELITHHQGALVSFTQGCGHTSLLRKHSQCLSAKCLQAGEPVGICRTASSPKRDTLRSPRLAWPQVLLSTWRGKISCWFLTSDFSFSTEF